MYIRAKYYPAIFDISTRFKLITHICRHFCETMISPITPKWDSFLAGRGYQPSFAVPEIVELIMDANSRNAKAASTGTSHLGSMWQPFFSLFKHESRLTRVDD